MVNWRRVREIADRAGAGEGRDSHSMRHATPEPSLRSKRSVKRERARTESEPPVPESMLLDLRYFLEMVWFHDRWFAICGCLANMTFDTCRSIRSIDMEQTYKSIMKSGSDKRPMRTSSIGSIKDQGERWTWYEFDIVRS